MKTTTAHEAVEIPAHTCECGFFTTMAARTPKPKDLTVCPGCGVALVFDDRLRLRPLLPIDMVGISRDELEALGRLRSKILADVSTRGIGGYN